VVAAADDGAEGQAPVPELRPGRDVGWIFENGDDVAVERRGDDLRSRPARTAPVRDE